jgi:hypothetical protein
MVLPLPRASDRAHFISGFTGRIYCWPLGCWWFLCPVWGFYVDTVWSPFRKVLLLIKPFFLQWSTGLLHFSALKINIYYQFLNDLYYQMFIIVSMPKTSCLPQSLSSFIPGSLCFSQWKTENLPLLWQRQECRHPCTPRACCPPHSVSFMRVPKEKNRTSLTPDRHLVFPLSHHIPYLQHAWPPNSLAMSAGFAHYWVHLTCFTYVSMLSSKSCSTLIHWYNKCLLSRCYILKILGYPGYCRVYSLP